MIASVTPDQWPLAVSLVASCNLPTEDLRPGVQQLWGQWVGDRLVGVIGVEVYGDVGLVRSMAVDPEFRGQGLASALYDELAAWWGSRGPLVLLTETAEGFFARRGFQVVDRAALPEAVHASAEFQGLCPVSAKAMMRDPQSPLPPS